MKINRFVIIISDSLPSGLAVLETAPPYYLGSPFSIEKKDAEKLNRMNDSITSGKLTGVKIDGYTIYVVRCGTLGKGFLDKEREAETLKEMGKFLKENRLMRKKHQYRKYEEGVPDDIDEQMGKVIKSRKESLK
ncbi:MAG: hypothetical protein WCS17_01740 [Prevotella sp.]